MTAAIRKAFGKFVCALRGSHSPGRKFRRKIGPTECRWFRACERCGNVQEADKPKARARKVQVAG